MTTARGGAGRVQTEEPGSHQLTSRATVKLQSKCLSMAHCNYVVRSDRDVYTCILKGEKLKKI